MIPLLFNNYEIEGVIGEGGMGSVYLASHKTIGRKVAIKMLNPELANYPHIRERFKTEAATMAALNHPTIVTLYEFLELPEGLFLIMEYVDGMPLDELIQKETGALAEPVAVGYFIKILEGFGYAHKQGVIHRDIKPSNIMISTTGQVKILDFGIAKLLTEGAGKLTRTGARMGTPIYMSPEQVRGQKVDNRSDIYSLGLTLYQMLTAKEPYDYQTLSEYDINIKIVNEPLIDVNNPPQQIRPEIAAIIAKATAKAPDDRYANCEDFRNALLPYALAQAVEVEIQTPKIVTKTPDSRPITPTLPDTQVAAQTNPSSTNQTNMQFTVIDQPQSQETKKQGLSPMVVGGIAGGAIVLFASAYFLFKPKSDVPVEPQNIDTTSVVTSPVSEDTTTNLSTTSTEKPKEEKNSKESKTTNNQTTKTTSTNPTKPKNPKKSTTTDKSKTETNPTPTPTETKPKFSNEEAVRKFLVLEHPEPKRNVLTGAMTFEITVTNKADFPFEKIQGEIEFYDKSGAIVETKTEDLIASLPAGGSQKVTLKRDTKTKVKSAKVKLKSAQAI
ncbi:MAG: serine/threonine protein kinase, partial [Bacteroidia bacterium]|nr:serine/threonine protein kinase [Bacteroidia bacterium]